MSKTKIAVLVIIALVINLVAPIISNAQLNDSKNIFVNNEDKDFEKSSINALNSEKREVVNLEDVINEDSENVENVEESTNAEVERIKEINSTASNIAVMSTTTEDIRYTRPNGIGFLPSSVIYSDNEYDYYVTSSESSSGQYFYIIKKNILTNTDEKIYTSSGKHSSVVSTYYRGKIIYLSYIPDYVWGTEDYTELRVLKYNTETDEISELGNFEVEYNTYDYYPSFAVDSKERFYFVSGYENVRVFENTGEMIYEYKPKYSEPKDEPQIEIIINGISPNDKALFFASSSKINDAYRYNEREGIQKLNEGKFVYEGGYTVFGHALGQRHSEDPNWQFLDDEGIYAVNQYGQIAKFDYDVDSNMGVKYTILTDLMRSVGDYFWSRQYEVPYTVLNGNLYLAGNDNLIAVFDENYNRIGNVLTNLNTDEDACRIERITNLNGNLYVRYYDPDKRGYYVRIINNAENSIQKIKNIVYDTHSTQRHTKEEIKEKYDTTVSYDYTQSMYKTEPSAVAPYVAGELQDGVVKDTLNRINFYRWLYGIDEVTLNSEKMDRNQKGAVLLRAIDELTHYPSQPIDMDDAFFDEAYDGCNASSEEGDTYSGNCSWGDAYLYESIDGYISDLNNVTIGGGAVGHRMSLLDPFATATSFGEYDKYSTLSMYYTDGKPSDLEENFYAFPSAGYFPSEQFVPNEYWSIYVTENLTLTEDFKIEFTYNGKTYTQTDYMLESSYPAIDFKMPLELINEFGGAYNNMPTAEIGVKISGAENNAGDSITYQYTVNFFSEALKGDVNRDGNVTLFDAIKILRQAILGGNLSAEDLYIMDYNNDNVVTLYDSIKFLRQAILG